MKRPFFLVLVPVIALAAACEQKPDRSVRAYREISMVADHAPSPDAAAAAEAPAAPFAGGGMSGAPMGELPPEMRAPSLPLSWTDPAGWEVKPGSGMRIATWVVEGQECTLMSFPGDVGGDEANIRRWLGQVGQSVDDDTLSEFVSTPSPLVTEGGLPVRFFDFSRILPEGATKSVLAGIIPVGDQSVFVKLMGDAAVLQRQRSAFEALCRSIALKEEASTSYE